MLNAKIFKKPNADTLTLFLCSIVIKWHHSCAIILSSELQCSIFLTWSFVHLICFLFSHSYWYLIGNLYIESPKSQANWSSLIILAQSIASHCASGKNWFVFHTTIVISIFLLFIFFKYNSIWNLWRLFHNYYFLLSS